MIFSALYSMLPTAMRYLTKADWDRQSAGFFMIACFVGGFVGIQIISRVLHQHLPSHIVDCDHTHKEQVEETGHHHSHHQSRASRGRRRSMRTLSSRSTVRFPHIAEANGQFTESTPLIAGETATNGCAIHHDAPVPAASNHSHGHRRPSLRELRDYVKSFVKDKPHQSRCEEVATCYGYSEPCGQECDKLKTSSPLTARAQTFLRSTTGGSVHRSLSPAADDCLESIPSSMATYGSHIHSRETTNATLDSDMQTQPTTVDEEEGDQGCSHTHEDLEAQPQHHHHVPENAFLSIGLQTVIAIALHKFPEGFITYATNHVSTSLGFNVFMALFVHNIAEGFSMALPLYLALRSRFKAIAWTALFGGLSQPLGAGMAVLWFKIANRTDFVVDNTAYACLFGITAGIMTSVALQLFVESLSLNHNRNLSILFAFLGMTMLGLSNALVVD